MTGRFDLFHSLDKGKQKNIIDAALAEFAEKGFKRASTNVIAQNAKIGKGMLFYYFGSKEELFDFLCEYIIEFAKSSYISQFKAETRDFIERYQMLAALKKNAINEYRLAFAFSENLFKKENSRYIEKHMKDITELREKVFSDIYGDIDYSLFNDNVDPETAIKYIKWLFNSYENSITSKIKSEGLNLNDEESIKIMWDEFDEFVEDIRKLFYKNKER